MVRVSLPPCCIHCDIKVKKNKLVKVITVRRRAEKAFSTAEEKRVQALSVSEQDFVVVGSVELQYHAF
jgi:hypothetical protein